jgi:hypothetical protein
MKTGERSISRNVVHIKYAYMSEIIQRNIGTLIAETQDTFYR